MQLDAFFIYCMARNGKSYHKAIQSPTVITISYTHDIKNSQNIMEVFRTIN
jgi:hypothetical protein